MMFSKYDVYTTVQSIYCYPDTDVLINKLNITDSSVLKEAEDEITLVKQMVLAKTPLPGRFSKSHLMNIHKFLFEDIYPFAGKIRREQISKSTTLFYPPVLINCELDKLFENIKTKNMLKETNTDILFNNLAYIMAELNIIHPFREGNGRTIREFIRCIFLKLGYTLNWDNVSRDELLEKSIMSVDDYKILIPILKKAVEIK